MRKDLEHLNVGSKINTLSAMDTRAQMQDSLDNARQQQKRAQRDFAALIAERNGFIQSWHNDIGDKLTDALGKLSDTRESLNKAQLHRQLVELRANQDGTVMTISKVSVGSVLNARPAVHNPGANRRATGSGGQYRGRRRRKRLRRRSR